MSDKKKCPFMNGKPCMKDACDAYMNVQGKDPQTGASVDRWGCSMLLWNTRLLIEQSKHMLEMSAAIESFRNEMVKSNQVSSVLFGSNPDEVKRVSK